MMKYLRDIKNSPNDNESPLKVSYVISKIFKKY